MNGPPTAARESWGGTLSGGATATRRRTANTGAAARIATATGLPGRAAFYRLTAGPAGSPRTEFLAGVQREQGKQAEPSG